MIYGFDWDGTLVESFTSKPLAEARHRLAALPRGAKTFIATNQAGPVFRAVLNDPKYPTVAQVCANLSTGLAALGWRPKLLLLCCASGRQGAPYWRAEAATAEQFDAQLKDQLPGVRCQTFIDTYYRKPSQGMLIAARGVGLEYDRDEMIYVGDMESDEIAARNAKARFVDAGAWLAGKVLE